MTWGILIIIITGSMITTGCDVEHLNNNYNKNWLALAPEPEESQLE